MRVRCRDGWFVVPPSGGSEERKNANLRKGAEPLSRTIHPSAIHRVLAIFLLALVPASGAPKLDPVFAKWHVKVDPAIERGLECLARIRNSDGSYPRNYGDSTGIPALAGMAFLSKGHDARAMFQIGGRHWREYADWMYAAYLPKQRENGSWDSREAGPVYGTSVMILAFTVPCRQLPIYQRYETVDE